jgi:hypothetical protein
VTEAIKFIRMISEYKKSAQKTQKGPQEIVDRVYGSISEEEWEILRNHFDENMELLYELENIEIPVPNLTKRVRFLLEFQFQSKAKEENGSDKPDQIQESDC